MLIYLSAPAQLIDPVPRMTLSSPIEISGAGIHSGVVGTIRLEPCEGGSGIQFRRPGKEPVPVNWRTADARESVRRTVIIGENGERFEQVEHLLAALAAHGITDVLVEQQGPEVPFLDGGCYEFMKLLEKGGSVEAGGEVRQLQVNKTLKIEDEGAVVMGSEEEGLRLSSFVEFPDTVVGNGGYSLIMERGTFFEEVSRARTFALARDIEALRAAGLIKGGNLENAVVFDHERYHNETLNYPDEVMRHKIIDLLGDLALSGHPLRGHFWAWKAGHRSHVLFVQHLMTELTKHA